ncbi:MAG: aldehyde dehydrogenase family protein, partial [Edaphobacter sp.]
MSVDLRAKTLRRLRNEIASHIDQIVAVVCEEVGKPPLDVLTGDIMVTLEQLRFYERCADQLLRSHCVGKPWFFFTCTRFTESWEPHGVALIFAPWNYPFQLAVVPMITGLFAGNAILLKCSEKTPRTAALIASLCSKAKLPDDLVQVSCEPPEAASELLDAQPDFLFFTGSSRNGRRVAQRAATALIPAVMELGGKDACLVFASCNLARAIEGVAYGAFSNAGQVCVGAKRIYVEQSIYDDFLHGFLDRIASLRIGTTLDSDMGPIRVGSVRELLSEQLKDALARGGKLHTAWSRDLDLVPPLVFTDVPSEALLLTQESFGPVVCIAPFQTEEDAIQLANSTPFALSASIFIGDTDRGRRIAARLTSATCAVNDVIRNIGNPQASFGGNLSSGNGRYRGPAGLYAFSRTKTVMVVSHPRHSEIHWFPFTSKTFGRLRILLLFRHGGEPVLKRLKHFLHLLILVGALSASSFAQAIPASPLSLDVTLPAGQHKGSIAYLVFSSESGFPNAPEKSLRHDFVPIVSSSEEHQRID